MEGLKCFGREGQFGKVFIQLGLCNIHDLIILKEAKMDLKECL